MKRLTKEQFERAIATINVGQRTRDIAYGVLVEGRAQAEFKTSTGLTKGAVSQAVKRVWLAAQALGEGAVPEGYKKVTAILPEHKAFQVEQWGKEAESRKQGKKPK